MNRTDALVAQLDDYLRGCPDPNKVRPKWLIKKASRLLWACREALAAPAEGDVYLRAVDQGRVTAHIGTAEPTDDYATAERKLAELIDWHVAVATDPAVNGGFKLMPIGAVDALKDPATVHSLMLRGIIAKPTWRAIVDLMGEVPNGEERQLARIAELQYQLEQASPQSTEAVDWRARYTELVEQHRKTQQRAEQAEWKAAASAYVEGLLREIRADAIAFATADTVGGDLPAMRRAMQRLADKIDSAGGAKGCDECGNNVFADEGNETVCDDCGTPTDRFKDAPQPIESLSFTEWRKGLQSQGVVKTRIEWYQAYGNYRKQQLGGGDGAVACPRCGAPCTTTEEGCVDPMLGDMRYTAYHYTAPPAASASADVEAKARELFTEQADRFAAPWDRQWEPTREYWRKQAREALIDSAAINQEQQP